MTDFKPVPPSVEDYDMQFLEAGEPKTTFELPNRRPSWIWIGLLILLVSLSITAAGIALYVRTPQYSVNQLRKSIVSRDRVSFNRYFDAESVAGDLVDATTKEISPQADSPLSTLVGGIAAGVRPYAVKAVKRQILDQAFGSEDNSMTGQPSLGTAFTESTLHIKKTSSRSAVLTVSNTAVEVPYVFGMERAGERWRVVSLENADQVAAEWVRDYIPAP